MKNETNLKKSFFLNHKFVLLEYSPGLKGFQMIVALSLSLNYPVGLAGRRNPWRTCAPHYWLTGMGTFLLVASWVDRKGRTENLQK